MCVVETSNNGKQLTNAALAIAYSQSSLTLPFIRLNAPFDYRSVSSSVNWIPYITITISMYAHVCNIIISEFRVLSVYIPQCVGQYPAHRVQTTRMEWRTRVLWCMLRQPEMRKLQYLLVVHYLADCVCACMGLFVSMSLWLWLAPTNIYSKYEYVFIERANG